MILRIIFLFFFIWLAFPGVAQNHIIAGKITAQGEPLESASVVIGGSHLGTRTGSNGDYQLNNVPGDTCQVIVSLVVYIPRHIRVVLAERQTELDVELEKDVSEMNQVIVTGVSKATVIRENPLAMEAVTSKDIEQTATNNVIDAIAAHAPGFTAVKTGPNVSKPFINGLGYNRVLTLYDGLRVETQQWGDEHGVPEDDYIIEKAEIIKGPASLMYGSDAIAGVLSLFPAVPHGMDGVLHARLLSEYQSNNGLVGNSLILSRSAPHWSWAVRGSERIARNYTDPVD